MRFLLKDDVLKYNLVNAWVNENWNKRLPDNTKPVKNFYIVYNIKDVMAEVLMCKLRGVDITEYDIIYQKANSKPDFVVPDIILNNSKKDGYNTANGLAYVANKEFLDNYNIKLCYEKLIGLAMSYLNTLGYADSRNFYEESGNVMYGHRERNRYDAHLLGDIVSGEFVMSSNNYDNILLDFKNKSNL